MTRYQIAHRRVKRLWGPASDYPCVKCGGAEAHWAYDGTDPTAHVWSQRCFYSQWPEFYMPLCPPCHGYFDAHWYEIVRVPVPPSPPPRAKKPAVERKKRQRKQPVIANPKTEREWDIYLRQQRRNQT